MTTKPATLDRSKFPLEVQCTSGVGSVAVVAAGAESKTPPGLDILAYSGGPLDLGYCLMYCDGDGAVLPASAPILRQHDAAKIVGQSTGIAKAAAGAITVKADFMPTEHAKEVRECAAAGMKWQASMGFKPDYATATWLDSKDVKATVNGREVTGPNVVIARSWSLKEVSVVPLGADGKTSATVTAFADPQQLPRRIPTMADPVPATVQQLRAAFPDAEDREFVLAQLEAGATLEAANAAYVGVLRERLTTAKAAPAPAPKPAPAPSPRAAVPVNAAGVTTAPAATPSPALIAAGLPLNAGPSAVAYFEAVGAFQARGMSLDDARAEVSRKIPTVHAAYVTEVNGGKEFSHFPMRTASGHVRR